MGRVDAKAAIFWSIPIGIGVVAAFLGYRALRERPWEEPPKDAQPLVRLSPCAAGQYRCHEGNLEVTTGDERDSGLCEWNAVATCARGCASSRVTLAGVDEATAKLQLCDPPRPLWRLVAEEKRFLAAPVPVVFASAREGAVQFDPSMLGAAHRNVDLSRFAHGNPIDPGEHDVELMVNDVRVARRTVRFAVPEGRAQVEACVDAALLASAGVRDEVIGRADLYARACTPIDLARPRATTPVTCACGSRSRRPTSTSLRAVKRTRRHGNRANPARASTIRSTGTTRRSRAGMRTKTFRPAWMPA